MNTITVERLYDEEMDWHYGYIVTLTKSVGSICGTSDIMHQFIAGKQEEIEKNGVAIIIFRFIEEDKVSYLIKIYAITCFEIHFKFL